MEIRDSIIIHAHGNAINAYNESGIEIQNSNISSNYNDNYQGYAISLNGGRLDFHGNSSSAISLSAEGHAISAYDGARININTNINFSAGTGYSDINTSATKIFLQSSELSINSLYLGDDSRLHFNRNYSTPVISQLGCSSGQNNSGLMINYPGIIFMNGNTPNEIISDLSGACIVSD